MSRQPSPLADVLGQNLEESARATALRSEDKMVRFADKERHQIFLEPEGLNTEEIYVNGISSSLPFDVQLRFIRSVTSLENAEIMRPAYAIEYDYVKSGQISTPLWRRK